MSGFTKEDVRKRLTEISRSGRKDKVQSALQKFGDGKFNSVAPKDYGALLNAVGEEKSMVGGTVLEPPSREKRDATYAEVVSIALMFKYNGREKEIKDLFKSFNATSEDFKSLRSGDYNAFRDRAIEIGVDFTKYYAYLASLLTPEIYALIREERGLDETTVRRLHILYDPKSCVGTNPGLTRSEYYSCERLIFPGDKKSYSAHALYPETIEDVKYVNMVSRFSHAVPFNLADAVHRAYATSSRLFVARLPIDAASIETFNLPAIGLLNDRYCLTALKNELIKYPAFKSLVVVLRDEADYWNAEEIVNRIRTLNILVDLVDYRGGYSTVNDRLVIDRASLAAALGVSRTAPQKEELRNVVPEVKQPQWCSIPSLTLRQDDYFVGVQGLDVLEGKPEAVSC